MNTLSVFDLIGFKHNNKKELQQLSLSNLMQFFNEIIKNKDNIGKFKKDFQKNFKHSNNIMNYSALTGKHMNFVSLFGNYFLNSHSFFFVLGSTKNDFYQESHFLYDKLNEFIILHIYIYKYKKFIRLSSISIPIERKQIVNCSQFLNFPSFIKSTEIFIYNYTEEDVKNKNEIEDITPEAQHLVQPNINENNPNINESLNRELKNIYEKIENLNSRIHFSEIAEESEENEKSMTNSAKKSSPKTPYQENKEKIKFENVENDDEKDYKNKSEEKGNNIQSNIYEIYDRKVKNIMGTLLNYEFPTTVNKGDIYIMKRNYDLLLNLFQVYIILD